MTADAKYDFVPLSDVSPEIEKQAKMIQFIKDQYFSDRIGIDQVRTEFEWLGILSGIIDIFVPDWERERDGRPRSRHGTITRTRENKIMKNRPTCPNCKETMVKAKEENSEDDWGVRWLCGCVFEVERKPIENGKWWLFLDNEKTRELTDDEAANEIWGRPETAKV